MHFLGNNFLTLGCNDSYHLGQRTISAVVQRLNQDCLQQPLSAHTVGQVLPPAHSQQETRPILKSI